MKKVILLCGLFIGAMHAAEDQPKKPMKSHVLQKSISDSSIQYSMTSKKSKECCATCSNLTIKINYLEREIQQLVARDNTLIPYVKSLAHLAVSNKEEIEKHCFLIGSILKTPSSSDSESTSEYPEEAEDY